MRGFASMVVAAALFALPVAANAAAIMPDFGLGPSGWVTDRYEPNAFTVLPTYQGRSNVLAIDISQADGFTSRPAPYQSTFYNTQGRQHDISGGAGSTLAADLYIPQSWSATTGSVRTDMWGVMTDGATVSDYPIIGFTNYGGAARLRVWDQDIAAGWVDLASGINYGAWNSLAIDFTGTSYDYLVNGALAYTDNTIGGSTGFDAAIMQAYNFYGDPSITGASPVDYTAHWSNAVPGADPVPEPSTLALLGLGLSGMALVARRRRCRG